MMLIIRSCPGAVLLLPLLDVHLSQLFQTADSVRSGSRAAATRPSVQSEGPGRQEFIGWAGFTVEDVGLASLRLLYLLVVHSDEVNKQYSLSGRVVGIVGKPNCIRNFFPFGKLTTVQTVELKLTMESEIKYFSAQTMLKYLALFSTGAVGF